MILFIAIHTDNIPVRKQFQDPNLSHTGFGLGATLLNGTRLMQYINNPDVMQCYGGWYIASASVNIIYHWLIIFFILKFHDVSILTLVNRFCFVTTFHGNLHLHFTLPCIFIGELCDMSFSLQSVFSGHILGAKMSHPKFPIMLKGSFRLPHHTK